MKHPVFRALFACAMLVTLAACGRPAKLYGDDIKGVMPDFAFSMTRAQDGKHVTAADYRGKVVLLYFGYTNCPDICPTTLSNLAMALRKLGKKANDVRVLFVTVDPGRDTLSTLKEYVAAFSPALDGLRGTPDEIARLARRYRIAYSVTPASPGHPYEVSHSSAVFFFDREGHARIVTMQTDNAQAVAGDIQNVMGD